MVLKEAESIGLNLNLSNCEIITQYNTTLGTILGSLPGAQVVDSTNATLLDFPLGDGKCVVNVTCENTAVLKIVHG